jgi:hypothetical protein
MWNVASPQAKKEAGVLMKESSCECVFCLQPATIYSLQKASHNNKYHKTDEKTCDNTYALTVWCNEQQNASM